MRNLPMSAKLLLLTAICTVSYAIFEVAPAVMDDIRDTQSQNTRRPDPYSLVSIGMTIEEAQAVLGSQGEEVHQAVVGNQAVQLIKWPDGFSSITVTFTDGIATSKSR